LVAESARNAAPAVVNRLNLRSHGPSSRDQLDAIAKDCGYAEGVGSIGSFKKSELVSSLLRHFASAHAASEPTPAQRKALDWLPEAMLFPAVDPSATREPDAEGKPDIDESFDEEPLDDAA
jgi:hypothetical protein